MGVDFRPVGQSTIRFNWPRWFLKNAILDRFNVFADFAGALGVRASAYQTLKRRAIPALVLAVAM